MEAVQIHNGKKSNIHLEELNGKWKVWHFADKSYWNGAVALLLNCLRSYTDGEIQRFICFSGELYTKLNKKAIDKDSTIAVLPRALLQMWGLCRRLVFFRF